MRCSEIVELLHATPVYQAESGREETEMTAAFASDLMSDALAMTQDSPESTLLLTGLCNPQVLRTADMLDIPMIVFVRGKNPVSDFTELACEMKVDLYTTSLSMYEACGVLYAAGLKGAQR